MLSTPKITETYCGEGGGEGGSFTPALAGFPLMTQKQ